MRNPVIRLALFVLVGIPDSSQAATSSSPADSLHFCEIFDYEQWRRDHPLPAAKGLADLDVGEPRTVRMVYFRPNDRPFQQEMVDSMKAVTRRVQTFYAEQMEAHGYGRKTFRIETDAQGEPLVHRVVGQHGVDRYSDPHGIVFDEVGEVFDTGANIYLAIVDGGSGPARGGRRSKIAGTASSPWLGFEVVAHELGHAFGLLHDWRDDAYIMSYGGTRDSLSSCAAEFLSVHPYFDSEVPLEDGSGPTVELLSPRTFPAGSERAPIQLSVGGSGDIHQAILFVEGSGGGSTSSTVKACRGLSGVSDVIEFDYDGEILTAWGSRSARLSDLAAHPLFVWVVDAEGNVGRLYFTIAEISPNLVATLEGHSGNVRSVAFSPDGKTLASLDWEARLWFVSARRSFATLHGVRSLSFSSLGRGTLAAGSRDHTITLWDGLSGKRIATLEGHTDEVTSLSFASSDGNTLASASRDGTINLWDVGARAVTGALHAGEVGSLSLSPNGDLLASSSGGDKAVKLWDVGTRELIGTLEGHRYGVTAVAFSPDGTTIASGSWDRTALLWDVETRDRIATLEGHGSSVTSVSFSFPAGSLLASGSRDGTVILWDVVTREKSAAFGHTDEIHSVSFSPVGATLAAGGGDGKVPMWDVSEWTRPRPWGVEIISGEGQQGSPGAELAQPLVVEVRDQYGDLLRDAEVTFTVTGGEGQLSRRFTVEHARTDASGRAEVALTLGPHRGANTVGVSLGGRDLATFTADGLVTSVAELEGDYRTWQLPVGVRARLGKGAMGDGDRAVALSADGECLAVASATGVWLYEARTSRAQALLPSRSRVHSVAFSLDGTLAAGLDNGQVELWAVETGERIATLRHGHWGSVTVVYSRDGTVLASGSTEQVIKLWDVETRRQTGVWEAALENRSYFDISVAFSPDGTRLASGFGDGTVRLWDVPTQTEVAILEGHTDRVTSVSFSPDGTTIASGSRDRTVILWDVETRDSIATLEGHGSAVTSVSFPSHGGGTLASGSSDHTIRLWDLATGESTGAMEEHAGTVYSVTWSRDGRTLASGSADGRVLLRDLASRNAAGLSGHAGLSSMALSPDGAILASGHPDGTVQLWDAGSRVPIGTLEGHTGGRMSLSFSPEGDLLAEAGGWQDRTIALWDVQTRRRVGRLEGHGDPVASMSFSPDAGATLASGSWDGTIKLWDVGTQTEVAHLEGHTGQVRALSFSPDGALLASASREDKGIKLWDVRTREWIGTLEGHEHEVRAVAFSPDGTTIASGSGDGTVILWDVAARESREILEEHLSPVNAVSFVAPSLLASGSSYGMVNLWDLGTRGVATLGRHADGVHWVTMAPDGVTMVSGGSDGTILMWDVSDWTRPRPSSVEIISGAGQQGTPGAALSEPLVVVVRDQYGDPVPGTSVTFTVTAGEGKLSDRFDVAHTTTDDHGRAELTLSLGPRPGLNMVGASLGGRELARFSAEGVGTPVAALEGDYRTWHLPLGATARLGRGAMAEGEQAVALSADGRCLAVATSIGVWLYEVETSRALALLPTPRPVQAVALSRDGNLAAGLDDGRVEHWEVASGTRIGALGRRWRSATSVAVSPDGRKLASGNADGTVTLWEVLTQTRIATLEGQAVSFSPDGALLALATKDSTVTLWEVSTRSEFAILEGQAMSFSPDGALLALATRDGTVTLWEVSTQTQVATLEGQADQVLSMAFSPDGTVLASASRDGTAILWEVATRDQIATLPGRADRVQSMWFTPDGTLLAFGISDGRPLVWDVETGNAAALPRHTSISSMAVSPDGSRLASGSEDGMVILWDLAAKEPVAAHLRHPNGVDAVAFSPDGALLASSGGYSGGVELWDLGTQSRIATLDERESFVSLAFSPDGSLLASGTRSHSVTLWNPATQERLATLHNSPPEGSVRSVSFSPDGSLLAWGSSDHTFINLEDMRTLEGVVTFVDRGPVLSLAFSPDGTYLASAVERLGLHLWDVDGPGGSRQLRSGSTPEALAFSPDGALLASGCRNGTVILWDGLTRRQMATLTHSAGGHVVRSVVFTPDGTTLASAASDGTVLLWDLQLKLPRPHRLTIVRKNGQQGPAGEALAEPFIVLVRDQNEADLAGVPVTFTVTAGGGRLSVETTTTDATAEPPAP